MKVGTGPALAALIAVCVVAAIPADGTAGGTVRPRSAPAGGDRLLELVPGSRAELERLEVEFTDARSAKPERKPISDLLLQISAEQGDVAAALAHPNGKPPASKRGLVRVRVMAVADGRIMKDARAWCGAFEGDITVCSVDCDGGRFGLRRRGETRALALMLGNLPREIDTALRPGFNLSACGLEDTSERRLVPRKGRPIVELNLAEE